MWSPDEGENLLKTSLTRLLRTELGLVRERRLELLRPKAYAPKAYVYTNFTTRAAT